jgi:hypothetical protein
MARTCCPQGYTYNSFTLLCENKNQQMETQPIECPCCPVGYDYSNATGTCIQRINGDSVPTITCPCCPDGYMYSSTFLPNYPDGHCVMIAGSNILPTIPCIDCNCTSPDDPTCPECGSDGLPIIFDYNPNIKNCTDCEPHDVTNPPGGIQDFIPTQFQDPITSTFVLRNKNFI